MDKVEMRCNARRIAYALSCTVGDEIAIRQLADILRYDPRQLMQDIIDLDEYTASKVRADRAAEEEDY